MDFNPHTPTPVPHELVVVSGPAGAGKSRYALREAERLNPAEAVLTMLPYSGRHFVGRPTRDVFLFDNFKGNLSYRVLGVLRTATALARVTFLTTRETLDLDTLRAALPDVTVREVKPAEMKA